MDHVGFLSASALSVLIEVLQAVVAQSTVFTFGLKRFVKPGMETTLEVALINSITR